MDTLIERKKRFTPKQIYGGTGVIIHTGTHSLFYFS